MAHISTSVHGRVVAPAVLVMSGYALIVASWSLSLTTALLGLPIALGMAWLVARGTIGMPVTIVGVGGRRPEDVLKRPRFLMVAMPVNHFGEKLRWFLDLVEADYEEQDVGGLLSLFLRGRTVPWLVDRQSASRIGSSDEAMLYVGAVLGAKLPDARRARLERLLTRTPESLAWEERLAAVGHAVQGWAYFYLLQPGVDPDLSLRYWGARDPRVPWTHRAVLRTLAPLLRRGMRRAFRHPRPGPQAKRRETIDACLDAIEASLAEHGGPFLFGAHPSYIDLGVCALLGPLLGRHTLPHWARGRFESFAPLADHPNMPQAMTDFEAHLHEREAGRYIVRTFETLRGSTLDHAVFSEPQ